VKMNVLLFAPGLLVLLLLRHGSIITTFYLMLCAAVQVGDSLIDSFHFHKLGSVSVGWS